MRITFILRSVVLSGGIERIMVEKANWLSEHGHTVYLLTYEQGTHPFSFPLSSKIVHNDMECRYFTIYQKPLILRPLYVFMLRRIFKKKIFEKVSVSDTDVIVVPHNLGEYRNEIASLTNVVPVIFEFHSTFVEIMSKRHSLGIWVNNIFFFRNLKKYNLVIALTHKDACYWKKYCRNVMSVVNPLSVYNETIPLANKTKGRIIYVGRLHPIKRVDRLVSAFSLISNKYPEWHIDIFGEGSEKTSILSLISDLSLESKIIIHPPVKDIYTEYLKSQMLVLCSDSESFSLVLVEAMSNGLPVISSNCPCGPAEIVENGVTGLLCDMSVEDLAAKMEWMITHEKERIEMGQRAHKAVSRYRKDIIMKEWENAYLSVIQ